MKALLIFSVLVFCALANFFLLQFMELPPWYSFIVHFFVGGILLAKFCVNFWIWFDCVSFWYSRPFFRVLGILSGNAMVGILWEVFEYWHSQGVAAYAGDGAWFYADTIWDFQMNFLGALLVALTYSNKLINKRRQNNV